MTVWKRLIRFLSAAAAAGGLVMASGLVNGQATAPSGMFKCLDAKGKTTYTGQECRLLGLKDAGPVRDALQTSPGQPVAAPAKGGAVTYRAPPGAVAPPAEEPKPPQQGQGAAPAEESERRCFTVKTAKGTVTRCNDKPE